MLLLIIWANINAQSGQDRVNELIIQEKIVNKPNRNDDSYCVNESIVDFNIEQLEYSNLPKRYSKKYVRRIIGSETFNDNISEKNENWKLS